MPSLHSPLAQPILRPDLGPLAWALPELIVALVAAVDRCIGRVMTWRQRAADQALLAEMNARALLDIGLTRSDVLVEPGKPFWRACTPNRSHGRGPVAAVHRPVRDFPNSKEISA